MNPRGLDLELPSLRGEINRWKCRSGPPLSFPSKRFKNYGREREKRANPREQTLESNNGEREKRAQKRSCKPKEEEGGFLYPPRNLTVAVSSRAGESGFSVGG
jgi:hypothetical protein